MGSSNKYCIDTSVLIDFHRGRYADSVFETVWEKLETVINERRILAPRHVYLEISQHDDDLSEWVKNHKEIFLDLDQQEQAYASQIINDFPSLIDEEKTTEDADPYVIALAKSKNLIVLTAEEKTSGGTKIPHVCREMKIQCFRLMQFFKEEGWKFR